MRGLATALLILTVCCAHDRGDADQTIAQLQKVVAADPNSFEAHYQLGIAYARGAERASMFSRLSLANSAKDEFERAVELNPGSADARLRLIEFYLKAPIIVGGGEENALAQAAELKKHDVLDGHRAYAHVYTLQKKYDLAVKELRLIQRSRRVS